mgnify:CR=1 FL=1
MQLTEQERLVLLLKQKGTGKTMSKSLSAEQLAELTTLVRSNQVESATISTILTAFLMLPNTDTELAWFTEVKNDFTNRVHPDCHFLFTQQSLNSPADNLINFAKLAIAETDLSRTEMLSALEYIFDNSIPEQYKTAFLEAERLKEESKQENLATLDFCYQKSSHDIIDLPVLIDIANPYDGFNRHYNLSLFLAPFLAALGFPVLLHGTKEVAPKRGINPYKLLKQAKKDPLKSINQVKENLLNDQIGWAYLDQTLFCPELHQLTALRASLVKRPVLTTIEKFLLPIQAQKTVMITGYTHPPYRQKTIDLLNHLPSLDGYLLVRGMEGSAQAPLDKRCPAIISVNGTIEETFIRPNDFSFDEIERVSPNTALSVEDTLKYSLTAFDKDSEAFKHLAFQAMAIITSLQLADQKSIRTKLNHSHFITNFKQRWERY